MNTGSDGLVPDPKTPSAGGEIDERNALPSNHAAGTCMHCYSTVDNQGIIRPIFCVKHKEDERKALGTQTYKYVRYFDSEQDAKDRRRILYSMYPADGYGTIVYIEPVSRWFLVLASWGSAD